MSLIERLSDQRPLVSVELRPPPSDLSYSDSLDSWIDMYHAIQPLARRDAVIFLTDNAVGKSEEENLRHLTTNLAGEVDQARLVPFLTCKHSLGYCLMYATRAASHGLGALTVLGGDRSVGPPRCVEHSYQLRQLIRERIPSLQLGGWANPHLPAEEQLEYMVRDEFTADFYLTQIVSHHSLDRVEAFLKEARNRDLDLPGVFGVFFYRSANPRTLERLGSFFEVPAEAITRDFESGLSPEEICARTIRRLRDVGADKVYVSNLGIEGAGERYEALMAALKT